MYCARMAMSALILNFATTTATSSPSVPLEPWQTKTQSAVYPTVSTAGQSDTPNGTAVTSGHASGCVLSPLDQACATGQQRFENGNLISGYELPHSAFIGVNSIGTLEVPPGQAACCDNQGGWLCKLQTTTIGIFESLHPESSLSSGTHPFLVLSCLARCRLGRRQPAARQWDPCRLHWHRVHALFRSCAIPDDAVARLHERLCAARKPRRNLPLPWRPDWVRSLD